MTTYPTVLTILRRRKGLTQSELAKKAGVSQPSVSNIENGNLPKDLEIVKSVAKAIGYKEDPITLANAWQA